MLKTPINDELYAKIGLIKNHGGYPDPYRILRKVLNDQSWFTNKQLADHAHVTANNVSNIKNGKQGDMKVSVLAKILTAIPESMRVEFFYTWHDMLLKFDSVVAAQPELKEELLGEPPINVDDLKDI